MTMDTTQTGSFLPQTVSFLSEQEMQKILETNDDFEDEYEYEEEEEEEEEKYKFGDNIEDWDRVFAMIAEQNRTSWPMPNCSHRDLIETQYLLRKQKGREIPGWPSLFSSGKAARRSIYHLSTEELQRLEHEPPIEEPKSSLGRRDYFYYSDEDEDDFDEWNRVLAKYAQWDRARRSVDNYYLEEREETVEETDEHQSSGETDDDKDDDDYDEYDREYTSFAQPVRTRRREKYLLPVY